MVPGWLLQGEESTQPRPWVGEGAMVAKALKYGVISTGIQSFLTAHQTPGNSSSCHSCKERVNPFLCKEGSLAFCPFVPSVFGLHSKGGGLPLPFTICADLLDTRETSEQDEISAVSRPSRGHMCHMPFTSSCSLSARDLSGQL